MIQDNTEEMRKYRVCVIRYYLGTITLDTLNKAKERYAKAVYDTRKKV